MSGARGAVAAGHAVTAQAAAEILADGGNAFDAAVAGLLAACVCEPVLASPGGGGFLAALHEGRVRHFDFFVAAPSQKRPYDEIEFAEVVVDFGTATQAFHVGAGASATPGFVPGLFAVHEALCRLPMRRLAEPALAAARDGVPVTAFQAYLFGVVGPIYRWTPEAAAVFAPGGELPAEAGTLRNPDLAEALDAIAREGARIATEGEIARAMAGQSRDHGGQISPADIRDYEVELRAPLEASLGRWRVDLNPPPALGGALVTAMLRGLDGAGRADAATLARAVDATDRVWREAPDDPGRLLATPSSRPAGVATRGTTHISVVDAEGNAAAVTVSNGEGNGRIVPGCGFMLNNMLGEEDLNPSGFHRWREGARLGSMMTPGIARHPDGTSVAFGSGGSNRIRTAILQFLMNRCAGNVGIEDAIFAARLHVERGHLDIEDFYGEADREALLAAFPDHRVWAERNLYFGGVHAVERAASGAVAGAGDPRRGGVFMAV